MKRLPLVICVCMLLIAPAISAPFGPCRQACMAAAEAWIIQCYSEIGDSVFCTQMGSERYYACASGCPEGAGD